MHTQGQLPPHFSPVLTPACHYRRLAPAVNDADEPNLLFREVPRRNVRLQVLMSGGGANLAAEGLIYLKCMDLLYFPLLRDM